MAFSNIAKLQIVKEYLGSKYSEGHTHMQWIDCERWGKKQSIKGLAEMTNYYENRNRLIQILLCELEVELVEQEYREVSLGVF